MNRREGVRKVKEEGGRFQSHSPHLVSSAPPLPFLSSIFAMDRDRLLKSFPGAQRFIVTPKGRTSLDRELAGIISTLRNTRPWVRLQSSNVLLPSPNLSTIKGQSYVLFNVNDETNPLSTFFTEKITEKGLIHNSPAHLGLECKASKFINRDKKHSLTVQEHSVAQCMSET